MTSLKRIKKTIFNLFIIALIIFSLFIFGYEIVHLLYGGLYFSTILVSILMITQTILIRLVFTLNEKRIKRRNEKNECIKWY